MKRLTEVRKGQNVSYIVCEAQETESKQQQSVSNDHKKVEF